MSEKEKKKGRYGWKILGLLIATIIVVGVIPGVYDWTNAGYTYKKNVHGHMENAYYADTPELMIEELTKAKEGMRNLGLTNDTYGKYWDWEKTPDWRMDYQYKHIDAIISRAEAIIVWRNNTYGENATGVETLGDVYEQKMNAVRMFIKDEGWSDDISQEAYYVKYHLWLHLWYLWAPILILLSTFLITICVIRGWGRDYGPGDWW